MTYNLNVFFTCNIAILYHISTYNFKFKKKYFLQIHLVKNLLHLKKINQIFI